MVSLGGSNPPCLGSIPEKVSHSETVAAIYFCMAFTVKAVLNKIILCVWDIVIPDIFCMR
jgi:hypothetical protein